ncbi:hypothetical protein BUALT_Bualt07G0102200 [Buddleja alternifolia]|uniref:Myb-like domain-containing protein n=1 Tax=Buddleja alternifolia TaxID=168488 RepID=A0AAV6XE46_9LAMI|nr:hypothetical protein BUALT_Bualt07G0102200 [Buddleja alternifolia]
MAPGSNGTDENTTSPHNVVDGQQPSLDDKNKAPRHPRWTRQETLVLIQGKNIAEERGRRGRGSSSVFGSGPLEPKWDFVSSYCRQHATNRGPVQCRKRWSNLVSDFKKIKTWENEVRKEGESYWMMRSDLRRERRLPGFFDQEVYDVLDGKAFTINEYQLALVTSIDDGLDGVEAEDEDEDEEDEEGLISEENSQEKEKASTDGKKKKIPSPVPISEMRYQPFHQAYPNQGTGSKRPPSPQFCRDCEFQEGAKRRRQSSTGCQNINVDDQLIKALERNTSLLNERLEAQKVNYEMDREQQKEQHGSLITALNKINDALEKIANKL